MYFNQNLIIDFRIFSINLQSSNRLCENLLITEIFLNNKYSLVVRLVFGKITVSRNLDFLFIRVEINKNN